MPTVIHRFVVDWDTGPRGINQITYIVYKS